MAPFRFGLYEWFLSKRIDSFPFETQMASISLLEAFHGELPPILLLRLATG